MTSYLWCCKTCEFTTYENRDYVMHRRNTGHDREFTDADTGIYDPAKHQGRAPADERTMEQLREIVRRKLHPPTPS